MTKGKWEGRAKREGEGRAKGADGRRKDKLI